MTSLIGKEESTYMKQLLIIILFFSLFSCSRIYDPSGVDQVYLETTQDTFAVGDTVRVYLINETGRSVYSHPPAGWWLSKRINGEWRVIAPVAIPQGILPSLEWTSQRAEVFKQTFTDAGLYQFSLLLSWDKDAQQLNGLGYIASNPFEIKVQTGQ